jgi:hypothetical protein
MLCSLCCVLKTEQKIIIDMGSAGRHFQYMRYYVNTGGVSGEGLTLAPLNCSVAASAHCLVFKLVTLNNATYVLRGARYSFLMTWHMHQPVMVLSSREGRNVVYSECPLLTLIFPCSKLSNILQHFYNSTQIVSCVC